MRARELGRSLLRATNNGITAVIDAQGRRSAELRQFEAAVLEAEVQVYEGLTPFARWGERPLWGLSLGFVSLLALWQHRRRAAA
jgi:apolipoprotein N-acyltransferase